MWKASGYITMPEERDKDVTLPKDGWLWHESIGDNIVIWTGWWRCHNLQKEKLSLCWKREVEKWQWQSRKTGEATDEVLYNKSLMWSVNLPKKRIHNGGKTCKGNGRSVLCEIGGLAHLHSTACSIDIDINQVVPRGGTVCGARYLCVNYCLHVTCRPTHHHWHCYSWGPVTQM